MVRIKQKTPRNKSKEKRKNNRPKGSVRHVDLTVPTKSNSHCIQRKPLSAGRTQARVGNPSELSRSGRSGLRPHRRWKQQLYLSKEALHMPCVTGTRLIFTTWQAWYGPDEMTNALFLVYNRCRKSARLHLAWGGCCLSGQKSGRGTASSSK